MTSTPEDAAESDVNAESADVRIEATFRESMTEVREAFFGHSPAVLITPDVDEDADPPRYVFEVEAIDLDPSGLVDVLRLCADHIETAAAREAASDA